MSVEYRVLGPLEVLVEGRIVDVGPPRHRGVLVLLIVHANTVVPADHLIEALWGDGPPSSAGNLVQGAVSGLRKTLGKDAITTRGTGYALRVEPSRSTCSGSNGWRERGASRLTTGTSNGPRRSWRRRSPCGEAPRWQTSPTSGSCGRSPWRTAPSCSFRPDCRVPPGAGGRHDRIEGAARGSRVRSRRANPPEMRSWPRIAAARPPSRGTRCVPFAG